MTMEKSSKVILVEDDLNMQAVLRTLLEIEGFQVSLAPAKKHLEDIVQSIHEANPEVILLDVHLNNVSGYDVLQQIRKDPKISKTRVIMSSGMDVKDQCMAAGANDFIMKPYMPDELINKLRQ